MKRILGAVMVAAFLFALAACSNSLTGSVAPEATPPASSASRNVRNEPVSVTETYAKSDVTSTAAPSATSEPAASETEAAATVETPATGNLPLSPIVLGIGMILLCAAGLVLLRRI